MQDNLNVRAHARAQGRCDRCIAAFLAAELAREQPRAPASPHHAFPEARDDAAVVARSRRRALLAAARSCPIGRGLPDAITTVHSRSPYALLVAARMCRRAVYRQTDELLRNAWNLGLAQFTDSIRKLRPPAAGTPGSQVPPTAPTTLTTPPGSAGAP
jgi:hypothetical protein